MKVIEKVVIAQDPPNKTNILWIDEGTLKYSKNGIWTSLTGGKDASIIHGTNGMWLMGWGDDIYIVKS